MSVIPINRRRPPVSSAFEGASTGAGLYLIQRRLLLLLSLGALLCGLQAISLIYLIELALRSR